MIGADITAPLSVFLQYVIPRLRVAQRASEALAVRSQSRCAGISGPTQPSIAKGLNTVDVLHAHRSNHFERPPCARCIRAEHGDRQPEHLRQGGTLRSCE